jgi:hypothetical protein
MFGLVAQRLFSCVWADGRVMAGLSPCVSPDLVTDRCGADCRIDKSGHSWRHDTGGAPLIEKTEEDPATCPIGQQAGELDKG